MLQGYKTYILAGLIAVATGVKVLGYIDESTYQTLVALLGAGAVSTLRASVSTVNKKLIWFFIILLLPTSVFAQTTVTVGPVDTSMKFAWDLPENIMLVDSTTFEVRLRDSIPTNPIVTVLVGVQCVAADAPGNPVPCTSQLTLQNVADLNRVGQHNLTLTYFRSDVGESSLSTPFFLLTRLSAPTRLRIIR